MKNKERYCIRKAAGYYWLLDMEQEGLQETVPIVLNETGAYIFSQYQQLQSEETVAEQVSIAFDISKEEAAQDVREFLQQLQQGLVL